jgi:hypothetical protein
MKVPFISILFSVGLLSSSIVSSQVSMNSDEILRSNEQVMDALMLRIQRVSDIDEKQGLIMQHMKHMDVYLSNLETQIRTESDDENHTLLQDTYNQALKRSLVLIDSGIPSSGIVVMGKTVDEHLIFLDKRMNILQALMSQVVKGNTIIENSQN